MQALEVLAKYGYAVVFGVALAEQVGLPVPAQPVLLAAGAFAANGRLNPVVLIGLAATASVLGDLLWYGMGRVFGTRVLGWLCRISMEPDTCVRKTQGMFTRQGARSLIVAKFIPGFSTVAPPLAGVVGMPFGVFLVFTAIGGLVWASVFVGLGWIFSAQVEAVMEYVAHFGRVAIVGLVGAFTLYLAGKWISRRRFLRKLRVARITPEELKAQLDRGQQPWVVDLRDRNDFEAEPTVIPGALHLTTEELEVRHREIPREREIVLYCT